MNRKFSFHQPVPTQESWWMSADRSSMTQAAREQQDRMNEGRCASFVNPLPRWFIDQRRNRPTDHTSAFDDRSRMAVEFAERWREQMAGEL
jgi:hypothetical protein